MQGGGSDFDGFADGGEPRPGPKHSHPATSGGVRRRLGFNVDPGDAGKGREGREGSSSFKSEGLGADGLGRGGSRSKRGLGRTLSGSGDVGPGGIRGWLQGVWRRVRYVSPCLPT